MKGIKMINDQQADLVLFTGDLYNDWRWKWRNGWMYSREVKALMGVILPWVTTTMAIITPAG